jgi:hypothetical protein
MARGKGVVTVAYTWHRSQAFVKGRRPSPTLSRVLDRAGCRVGRGEATEDKQGQDVERRLAWWAV